MNKSGVGINPTLMMAVFVSTVDLTENDLLKTGRNFK